MQLRYKFFRGGTKNPFEQEVDKVYSKLTEERLLADPSREQPLDEVFPKLDSWADYVVAMSKSTFWQMERAICEGGEDKAEEINEFWQEAKGEHEVGEWLKEVEADESEEALCFYMASQYYQFNPDDRVVDFRLYFSEGGSALKSDEFSGITVTPYEG